MKERKTLQPDKQQTSIFATRRTSFLLLAVALCGIGIGIGAERAVNAYSIYKKSVPDSEFFKETRSQEAENKFSFINPLIGFETPEVEYKNLEEKINTLITQPDIAEKITNISIYFGNLETGQWVGINENEAYDPASLLKVPLMMAYFKFAEQQPDLLNTPIYYGDKEIKTLSQTVGADQSTRLVKGHSYLADDLIREMIVHSDNVALYLLANHLPKRDLDNLYTDLGIGIGTVSEYTISAKTYSLFFRTLYNATLLSRESSEKALTILSKAEFTKALAAGVPEGIDVAHKFGIFDTIKNGRTISTELHDCGIIYTSSPYLLCVMTKGNSTDQLTDVISKISELVYQSTQ